VNGRMHRSEEGAGVPARPSSELSERMESLIDSFARVLLVEPRRAAIFFWAAGSLAILVIFPLEHWSTKALATLSSVLGACLVALVTRILTGKGSAYWTLHIDVVLATVMATALSWTGATRGAGFVNLYVWIALYAAVYFRPVGVILHVGLVAIGYALVLSFGPKVTQPFVSWFGVIGTASVSAVFVLGLVNLLRASSRIDSLTGLANRRFFDERFDEELERSRRSGDEVSIALIDIDGFKIVNDRSGHDAGDKLLIDLATRWQAVVREGGDFLGRIGGDEFVVLAPGSDELGVRRLVERLAGAVPDGVSVSIGTATWDRLENSADLLRKSDQAMYKVKLRHRSEASYRRA